MDLSSSPLPKRLVILIDLHPLFTNNLNSDDYISRVLATLREILHFPPLSKSLFAFKLFISSLSPIQSSSKINAARHLSFQYPSQTLISLSKSLISISKSTDTHSLAPRASFISKFLLTLEHDYSWEDTDFNSSVIGMNETSSTFQNSNLVLLFSPSYTNLLELEEGLDFNAYYSNFVGIFGLVKEKFVSKGIGFCSINFDFGVKRSEFGFFEKAIRKFDWGFCWADAIVLGSAFVPFGMILNYIGCGVQFCFDKSLEKIGAELILEITDAKGKPLECKIYSFEVIELKPFLNNPKIEILKINVQGIWIRDENNDVTENSIGQLAMRGITKECRKKQNGEKGEFIVNNVLDLLCADKDEYAVGEPIWEILLSFLYRRNYWASVSIVTGDGNLFEGVLKPFTVNYAAVSIMEKNTLIFTPKLSSETSVDLSIDKAKDVRRKRSKMQAKMFQQLTWNSLCEAAFTQNDNHALELDLEEVYFSTETGKSKKMRFLKCWMAQMEKSIHCCQLKLNEKLELPHHEGEVDSTGEKEEPHHKYENNTSEQKELLHHQDELNNTVLDSQQELDVQASCSSNNPEPSLSIDRELLLKNIPEKIEQTVCSKETDLWNLAQRLVTLCVDVHCARSRNNTDNEYILDGMCETPEEDVLSEVSRLLLIKPKDLMLKYKKTKSAPSTSDHCSVDFDEGTIIRAHELQILFRMEILKSEGILYFGDTVKKLVKEICSLLQNIEFYLQGEFLSGESLLDFAERTIKHRYVNSLKDIIHNIYEQMEFLSFGGDEMDSPSSLPNSNSEEKKKDENENSSNSKASTSYNSLDALSEECIMNAQSQRERARRLSAFTSWAPDLRRVWALKRKILEKPALDSEIKKSKTKRMKIERSRNEVVCETPAKMTKLERSKSEVICETPMSSKRHLHVHNESSSGSGRSLSKALFQNEVDDLL